MNKFVKTTIVLLVMVGIASAAYNMNITDPPSTELMPGGAHISYTIDLTGIEDTQHSISSTIIWGTTGDLEFQFVTPSGTSGWLASGVQFPWTSGTGNESETLTMNVKAIATPIDPIGSTYEFNVADIHSGLCSELPASASTTSKVIPEFPTIALPIAAILGLMFIISSRKKKE